MPMGRAFHTCSFPAAPVGRNDRGRSAEKIGSPGGWPRQLGVGEACELAGGQAAAIEQGEQEGRWKRYQANAAAPIFHELRAIVEKTAGVPGQLRAALAPLMNRIKLALLYGSVAKQTDTAISDIDVLVVSDDLTLEELFAALEDAEHQLGRRVSPTLYTSEEFQRRRQSRHPFLTRVLEGPHALLEGSRQPPRGRALPGLGPCSSLTMRR